MAYIVGARRLAGTLDWDALVLLPMFALALFIWWPQLVRIEPDNDRSGDD